MSRRRKTHLGDRDIPVIKIRTSEKTVETIDVASDLYVTDNMDREFDRNPSLFSWYGTVAEDANTHAKKLKLRLKEKSSVLKTKYRNQTQGSGSRVTVAEIDAIVTGTPLIRRLERRLIEAEAVAAKLKVYKEAFNQRRDMLISKGAHRRAEGEVFLKTLEENAQKTTRRSKKERV